MDCPTPPPVPPVAATLSLRHEDAPLTVEKIVCGAGKKPRGGRGEIIWGTLCSIEGRFIATNFQYLSSAEMGNK